MNTFAIHEFHQALGASFGSLNDAELVTHYGDASSEYRALREGAGVLDLSFRSRLCLAGSDRLRFLHGQVTNDIKGLRPGQGCYAALVNAKGKMESDLNVFCLADELLLDFEPGLGAMAAQRLEKYIVADDVQVVDVASSYGLLSVQGPRAGQAINELKIFPTVPTQNWTSVSLRDQTLGELCLINHQRLDSAGFDLFVPVPALAAAADKLLAAARVMGGLPCGWEAFETLRIESGIPRFGADMDETNFPQESGIEATAVSYTKGCYIGQEVLNRIHTMGHVNKQLRTLRLPGALPALPSRGDKLYHQGKEVGYVTSSVLSHRLKAGVALAYVRKECNQPGTELEWRAGPGTAGALCIIEPFTKSA